MTRGTTPLHIFTLPKDVSEYENFIITYRQNGGTILSKSPNDVVVDGNKIRLRLTAEETLKFDSGERAFVQVKVLDDGVVSASAIFGFPVNGILDETPISPAMDEIRIVRGTTHTFRVEILEESQEPYIMKPGEILRLGVKENIDDTEYVLKKEVDSSAYDEGEYLIPLSASDTMGLDCKKYWYDIGLQSDEEYYMVIECSPFVITPNVTSLEGD